MDDQKTIVVSVHAKDCVDYQCRRCGQCCRHIKDSLMVESLDAYRLANYLRGCDPNICTIDDVLTRYCEPRQGPLTFPYEKYGSVHPIQLKVSAYMDGNLAIAMHTWENGYAEPWASLTVNLDGERGKDCAFIDTNGDADFPVWLIRHGLAIPTGATQRSGYCEYPEYRFRADRLRELDPEGYAEYLSLQEERRSA